MASHNDQNERNEWRKKKKKISFQHRVRISKFFFYKKKLSRKNHLFTKWSIKSINWYSIDTKCFQHKLIGVQTFNLARKLLKFPFAHLLILRISNFFYIFFFSSFADVAQTHRNTWMDHFLFLYFFFMNNIWLFAYSFYNIYLLYRKSHTKFLNTKFTHRDRAKAKEDFYFFFNVGKK